MICKMLAVARVVCNGLSKCERNSVRAASYALYFKLILVTISFSNLIMNTTLALGKRWSLGSDNPLFSSSEISAADLRLSVHLSSFAQGAQACKSLCATSSFTFFLYALVVLVEVPRVWAHLGSLCSKLRGWGALLARWCHTSGFLRESCQSGASQMGLATCWIVELCIEEILEKTSVFRSPS